MERHLTRLPRRPDRESLRVFGPVTTPDLLEAKSLRRDDGSGQTVARQVALRSRIRRLVGLILSNPIRRRPCADPVQKQDPGERITKKRDGHTEARYRRAGKARSACPPFRRAG